MNFLLLNSPYNPRKKHMIHIKYRVKNAKQTGKNMEEKEKREGVDGNNLSNHYYFALHHKTPLVLTDPIKRCQIIFW